MKQKGGVLTRSMARKLTEKETKKSSSSTSASSLSSRDSNEAGPSIQVKKPSTRKKLASKDKSSSKSSNEAGPSVPVKKTTASKKKPVDEKKEIKKIENQFKAEMVGLLKDKEQALKDEAFIKVELLEQLIGVLTQMKNKVEEDIDDDLATLEEVKQELELWRNRKKAITEQIQERLNEEEANIKEKKKQANAEKYKVTKLRKILRDELKELRYKQRHYIRDDRERVQVAVLVELLEEIVEDMPNTVQELEEIIQDWYNLRLEAEQQLVRERDEARRRAEEERARQQAAQQAAQRALQELDQRAERIRIEEEEARRREKEREEIREGKKPIQDQAPAEKKEKSDKKSKVSRLSKTEKSVLKVTKAFEKLKIYENKMKTIPKEHIQYTQNGIEMFKKFVRLGRELLQKNRNPTLAQIKDYTGFHLHRDSTNTVTFQENLNYAEKVTKDLEKALAKDPVFYTRIHRLNPFEYYCIDGRLDKVASVIYGDHVWQSDKDLDSNLSRVIENYITPYCDDINLLYGLKGADNIKKAIDLYEHIHIKKVEEAVLNYPEVKKLCNTKAQCDLIHKKLHDLLKDPDSFMSITQEDDEQYVACSEDIPSLSKLRKNK